MTVASSKLAKAQQLSAAKGVRNALSLYLEAARDLASERRYDDAAQVLLDLLNLREKKRSLFGAKEINPLAAERLSLAKNFAQFARLAAVSDPILELLGSLAAEFPDEPELRLANAEALYRGAYIADAIDEYRYCEKISPNDGSVIARLGELYAMMSRQSEAVEQLRRGIARLQESGQCAGLAHFALKLFEIDHECANEAHDWLYSLSDEDFAQQRLDIERLLNAVREAGSDDGRWAAIEQRLAELPAVVEPEPPQPQDVEAQEVSATDWDSSSAGEPAGEDEMREFFAASAPTSGAAAQAQSNGVAATAETQEEEEEPAPPPPTSLQVSAGRSIATSLTDETRTSVAASSPLENRAPAAAASSDIASPLPPGLAAYTRRKADGLLASGDYEGASTCYERLLRAGFEPSVAEPLLRCYLESGKVSDGIALGLQLADHQSQAGELDHAVQTLAKVLEYSDDAEVTQRHSELLASLT